MPRTWIAVPDEGEPVARLLAAFRDWYGKDEPSDASFRASVDRLIAAPDAEYVLGAPDGAGQPLAVAQVRYRHSVWTGTDDCWLEDLFVAEDARGSGLGRAMVHAVLDRARERGCRRIELDVDDDNEPARRLYESLGFREKSGGAALMQRRLD